MVQQVRALVVMSDDPSSSPQTLIVERANRLLHVVHWPPSWYASLSTLKINAIMKKEIKEVNNGRKPHWTG